MNRLHCAGSLLLAVQCGLVSADAEANDYDDPNAQNNPDTITAAAAYSTTSGSLFSSTAGTASNDNGNSVGDASSLGFIVAIIALIGACAFLIIVKICYGSSKNNNNKREFGAIDDASNDMSLAEFGSNLDLHESARYNNNKNNNNINNNNSKLNKTMQIVESGAQKVKQTKDKIDIKVQKTLRTAKEKLSRAKKYPKRSDYGKIGGGETRGLTQEEVPFPSGSEESDDDDDEDEEDETDGDSDNDEEEEEDDNDDDNNNNNNNGIGVNRNGNEHGSEEDASDANNGDQYYIQKVESL